MPQDYFKLAQEITKKYARDIKDAENSVLKPRICQEHAVSREILANQELASVSMNEILEAAGAEGLMQDPLLRMQFKQMGMTLNSDFKRF